MAISGKNVQVRGTVVIMKAKKASPSGNNFGGASVLDTGREFLGQEVSFQLVSSTVGDPSNGNAGVVGEPAYMEEIASSLKSIAEGEFQYSVTFNWDESQGIPGAIIVKNKNQDEFFLKCLTIEEFPSKGRIHFDCTSWVYNVGKYAYDRIFFTNDTYLPENTPDPLKPYRQEELLHLRGDDVSRKMEEWDRIYKYAYYNDLGDPDNEKNPRPRPVLGGSENYPYPRRGYTGRPHANTDPNSESRSSDDFYVPRDEKFGHLKDSDFREYKLSALFKLVVPVLNALFDPINQTPLEFDSFRDILRMFEGGLPVPDAPLVDEVVDNIPFDSLKETIGTTKNGERLIKYSKPHVIQVDPDAWDTDEEFAREMLAGVNPVIISRLQEFPPTSKLDPAEYGNQNSTITAAHIEYNLDGLTVEQALSSNKLFILDHHDSMMPYVQRINSTTNSRIYATRTLLFLKEDGTLKPLAIELSLPNSKFGAVSQVITPSQDGVEGSIWQLAKAYVVVNDSGVHQLISHWLLTHASIEPFVIASNRHLSAMHPINKLLAPHYRDTMNINAMARKGLINAGGIIEITFFPVNYSMEMSSAIYKSWNFLEQALPADLIKRGVAVEDPTKPNKLSVLIEDYPYAVDGLKIWSAIETWVSEYCSVYYPSDATVQTDVELQAWWREVREVGHGDKKDEPWWPRMQTVADLIQSCTIIIWVSSALHAAVNFGQYPYAGYLPNRPTLSRKFMPEPGSDDYERLRTNPEKVFLETITRELQCIIEITLIEILSTHSSDEIYLGQRDTPEWTKDEKALAAFDKFGARLREIETVITDMNSDPRLLNRQGPVQMPYNLLFPTSEPGLTAKGIPNSISI